MKQLFLKKIRLTYYLVSFFVFFMALFFVMPGYQMSSSVMTLFSVNSFLYGFYISPIVSGQKARIDELHKIIRNEANTLYGLQIKLKRLSIKAHDELKKLLIDYISEKTNNKSGDFAEEKYEEIITYCIRYSGDEKDIIMSILDILIANQQNRTQFMMQMSGKIYGNEWMIMTILFSITLGIIAMMDTGGVLAVVLVKAMLCTSLSMLMVTLIKLNTLTHKKAKQVWQPFEKMLESDFYRID